jgi:tetratricopeptide (TPR) repeat protein
VRVIRGGIRRTGTLWLLLAVGLLALLSRGQEAVAGWYVSLGGLSLNRAALAPDLPELAQHELRAGAGRHFQRALAHNPGAAGAYYNLGAIYIAWEDPDAAAAALSEALTRAPGRSLSAFQLGQAHAALGREAEARAAWRHAAWHQPAIASYFVAQAADYHKDRDYAAALLAAERAVDVGYGQVLAPAFLAQGKALEALERFPDALTAYEAAAMSAPREPEAFHRAALVLERRLDRTADAVMALDRALGVDATYAPALLDRARHDAAAGECARAAARLAPLLAPDAAASDLRRAAILVGACYLDQDHPAAALPLLIQAVAAGNDSVQATWLLARAYHASGDRVAAAIACRRVLELQPDHSLALALIEELSAP